MRPHEPERALSAGTIEQIQRNLRRCRELIASAQARAAAAGPDRGGDVELVAVTKYVSPQHVRVLHDLGLRDFGESTVQGGEAKRAALADLAGCRWHLIGHLQRNKVARALRLFDAIHSLDSGRLAREIAAQAVQRGLPVPELYVELQLTGETEKTGLPCEELRPVIDFLRGDDSLLPRLRGLMAMAPHARDPEAARPYFRRLRQLRDELHSEGRLQAKGLSMGMSGDFVVAIEEGATVVRVGSMLFENAG